MAHNTYVTNGYSNRTNIPAQRDGYDVVETKAVKRIPASADGYTDFMDSPSVVEPLKECGYTPTMSGGPKYAPKNHYDDYESNYRVSYDNSSLPFSPNKYNPGYLSEESNRVHSGAGYVRTGTISCPNNSWQVMDPPATRHSPTRSTNNINEALGLPEEYVLYSKYADPRLSEMFKKVIPHAFVPKLQSGYGHEHEYNAFVPELQGEHGYNAFVPKLQSGYGHEHEYYTFVPELQSEHEYNAFVPKRDDAYLKFISGYTSPPHGDPKRKGVLDDKSSNKAHTLYTSPPEPRRIKWRKGAGWWKTREQIPTKELPAKEAY